MWLVSVKRRTDIRGVHKGGKNLAWIGGAAVVKNIATYPRPMDAAELGMMRVSDDRCGEPNLGFRDCDGIGDGSKIRHRIIGGIKTVGPDSAQIGDRRFGAAIGFAVGDPQRRIIAAGIEGVDAGPLSCVADDAVEFSVRKIVQLFDEWSIGVDSGARGARRCGLTG